METLAYVHLAVSFESPEDIELRVNPFDLRWFEQPNWKKLPSSAWIGLGAIAISLSLLTIATSSALALQTGNQGSQVTTLQQKLTAAGYYNGSITGFYGSATQAAVRRFQEAKGLPVDGIAGATTLSALYGTSDGSSNLSTNILLRRGSRGTAVTQLQNTLKAQGFYNGSVTGYYGRFTEEAVRNFQQAKGLSVDGIAGSKTLSALGGSAGIGNTVPTGTQLQLGSSGSAVTQLQNRLTALGFYKGPITGYYSRLTEEAVRDFQRSRGLSVNGIAGPTTLGALQANSPGNSTTPILQRRSRGTAVAQLQNRLIAVGVYKGPITGYYGELTEAAVRNFQRSKGLSVNGIADSTTLAALKGVSPGSRTSVAIATRPSAQPIVSLQQGSRSSRVRSLQARLTELGYYKGSIDGVFGSGTETALKRYQQDAGLVANGIAEAKTFASLASQGNNSRERSDSFLLAFFQ